MITFNRGNHEEQSINNSMLCGGFLDEVLRKYGKKRGVMVYEAFKELYDWLPLAAVVNSSLLVRRIFDIFFSCDMEIYGNVCCGSMKFSREYSFW